MVEALFYSYRNAERQSNQVIQFRHYQIWQVSRNLLVVDDPNRTALSPQLVEG